jgi:hypothetical protein
MENLLQGGRVRPCSCRAWGHRAATGYDHQLRDVVNLKLRDVVNLTVDNNGPLAVFAIVLNNRCHLRRFRFSLFDRGRIPAPIWTIVSA